MNEQHRLYGRTKIISEDELKHFFNLNVFDYMDIVLLFGSRARGDFHQRSDYDFAVLLADDDSHDWGSLSKAWVDIGENLNLNEVDYDVIDLSTMTPQMKDSIKKSYKIIKDKTNDVSRIFR